MKTLAIFLLFATIYCVNGYSAKEEKVYPHKHYITEDKYVVYKHAYPYVSIDKCSVYTKDFYARTCDRKRESHMCVQDCHYDSHCEDDTSPVKKVCCWVDCRHLCEPESYIKKLKQDNEREKALGLHWYYRGEDPPSWKEYAQNGFKFD